MYTVSAPEQLDQRLCALCGRPWARFAVDGPPLCEACQLRVKSSEAVWPSYTVRPVPKEKRFDELFRAAHMLLTKRVDSPDQIIPTLAFAHEVGRGLLHLPAEKQQMENFADRPEAWNQAADRFARTYSSRPIRVVRRAPGNVRT